MDKLTFTVAEINTAIERMAKSQLAATKSIAVVIVMAAWDANVNGKADVANSLMKNLRKGMKKDAIVAILEEKCNLAYASGTFQTFDAGKGWTAEEVALIKVAAAGWEAYKKADPAPKELDAIAELEALTGKLAKKAALKQLNHADALDKIQALLGSLKAAQILAGN